MVKKIVDSFASEVLLPVPSFPAAIIEPPTQKVEENLDQLMPIPYTQIESPSQPLKHLISMYEALERSNTKPNQVKKNKDKTNPYKVPLRFVDRSTSRKKKNKDVSRESHCRKKSSAMQKGNHKPSSPVYNFEDEDTLLSKTLVGLAGRVSIFLYFMYLLLS